MSVAKNIGFLSGLPKFPSALNVGNGRLEESKLSASNPGNLGMHFFIPEDLPKKKAPLVVVLHGCTQTADGYDTGAGWSTLAERYGFALLMPEQRRENNANGCFNWFEPEDTARGRGEVCSIRQMIEQMAHRHGIDKRRIFVTGLSAGGAMTSAMLAAYPEVFAGGAIIAGLPHGVASNLQEALSGMFQAGHRSSSELGELIRNASNHRGPWPKISVWHGSSDKTVNPLNADYIVNQWLDVHGLPAQPMSQDFVDGYPHRVWWDSNGKTVVESFAITGMAHGTPLGTAENEERYGLEGAFLIEAGISSSYHIAKFFGLTDSIHKVRSAIAKADVHLAVARPSRKQAFPQLAGTGLDIGATINNALKAAGLMK